MDAMNDVLLLLNLVFGIYCLIGGFTKKGGMYNNNYPKEIQADVKNSLSVLMILAGFLLTVSSLLEIFNVFSRSLVVYVSWALCMILIVVYAIYFKRRFGKFLK